MRRITRWMRCGGLVLVLGLLGAGPETRLAPPIVGRTWLNSAPIAPRALRGKVTLVEFWTFDCINCIRTVPAMRSLYATWRDSGVVVVGVHSPELERERSIPNVKRALDRLDVRYPVVIDGDLAVWRAFRNEYWPCLYVVDKRGVIRATHVGELHEGTSAWAEVTGLIARLVRESS